MEVGLVGVAGLRRHPGGTVACGQEVGGVVETDQLGGALGGAPDLGSEPGPQPLPTPADLGCQLVDPNLPTARDELGPDEPPRR
jgi:hypothetical protein